MIISDKQELRRCVKQIVRRADVCEASLDFDMQHGELGVAAMLDCWARPAMTPGESFRRTTAEQTPFSPDAAAMFAALSAMDLPTRDLDRAHDRQQEYVRGEYLVELMDTLRARCVLVRVALDDAPAYEPVDARCMPMLALGGDLFVPGRYGVDYAACAKRIADAAALCGAENVCVDRFDEAALRYCVLPACQDGGFVLHMHLCGAEEIERFSLLLDEFDGVRALVFADDRSQRELIGAAARRTRMLVCLGDLSLIGDALEKLGTRFVPFAAKASLPEMMLGRWALAKEKIWQALFEAYLPLARAGYELESAAIERDVRRLLSGNLLSFIRRQEL